MQGKFTDQTEYGDDFHIQRANFRVHGPEPMRARIQTVTISLPENGFNVAANL